MKLRYKRNVSISASFLRLLVSGLCLRNSSYFFSNSSALGRFQFFFTVLLIWTYLWFSVALNLQSPKRFIKLNPQSKLYFSSINGISGWVSRTRSSTLYCWRAFAYKSFLFSGAALLACWSFCSDFYSSRFFSRSLSSWYSSMVRARRGVMTGYISSQK